MSEKLETKSLQSNLVFNVLRKILTYLFPILIFPYVNRVLGPENIGSVRFAESIVNYFVLFTGVGIPSYGLRVIARTRDNVEERSRAVWELTKILIITSFVGYLIYFILVFSINRFNNDYILFLIISPTILLSDFSYEWFFQGIENQSFITIRFVIVKIVQLLCTFLFIHSPKDYYIYAFILVGMSGISTVFNITKLKEYVIKIPKNDIKIKKHFKSLSAIFISSLAISVYTQLDVTMVGFIVGDEAVGYYTASNTIIRMIIVAVTAFAEILTPRIENALNNDGIEEYYKYLNLSIGGIILIAFPACLGLSILANDVIMLFAGSAYIQSISCMKLLCPIIIISGIAYFVGTQILYSQRTEWKYSIAVVIAALANLVCNLILIPRFNEIGAVIGTLIAETIGLIIQLIYAKKIILKTSFLSIDSFKIIISSIFMYVILRFIPLINNSYIIHCLICVIVGAVLYFSLLLLLKVKVIVEVIGLIKTKIK